MTDIYKHLGFKQPAFLENHVGIRIYIGSIGKDDWTVVIPKEIAQKKCPNYTLQSDYVNYLVTESEALRIAEEFTTLAERKKV